MKCVYCNQEKEKKRGDTCVVCNVFICWDCEDILENYEHCEECEEHICKNCIPKCKRCKFCEGYICPNCEGQICVVCQGLICSPCYEFGEIEIIRCSECWGIICEDCIPKLEGCQCCGVYICSNCGKVCDVCKGVVCSKCCKSEIVVISHCGKRKRSNICDCCRDALSKTNRFIILS